MIDGIRVKVCGLTSLVDAEFADRAGADYLGFILYPKSPRYVPRSQMAAMAERLPTGRRRVAVLVEPTGEELNAVKDLGFDYFQLHFRPELGLGALEAWSECVGPTKLWLAPRLRADEDVKAAWLALAGTVMLDTFSPTAFGGTGHTGDWGKFLRHQNTHTRNKWVLAGGLNPENVGDALRESQARIIDVNSGVESAPGIKDHAKIRAFMVAIHRAVTAIQGTARSAVG